LLDSTAQSDEPPFMVDKGDRFIDQLEQPRDDIGMSVACQHRPFHGDILIATTKSEQQSNL
jgi:hypothetical protein